MRWRGSTSHLKPADSWEVGGADGCGCTAEWWAGGREGPDVGQSSHVRFLPESLIEIEFI